MADCNQFDLPPDWPADLGIDPYAPKDLDNCPPFVFPQPEPDDCVDPYLVQWSFWIHTPHNRDKQQLTQGRGNAPMKKYRRITPSQRNI